MYLTYLCIALSVSHGARYIQNVLAKYLKSEHLKMKPPTTSPDWSKVENCNKKVEVTGYVKLMCLHEFYSSDGGNWRCISEKS